MKANKGKGIRCLMVLVGVALLMAAMIPGTAAALTVTANFTGFTNAQKDVINAAIAQWKARLDGHAITINFSVDNTMSELGSTGGWVTDASGRPTSVNVKIKASAHNWTTGAPVAGQDDAMDSVMHEIGHGIGFTVLLAKFSANVKTVAGNRFYDLNHNGTFEAADDFDLIDDATQGTHAPAGSGDLLQPSTPQGQRHFPTDRHAKVLSDAYGYTVVPEPSSVLLLAGGVPVLAMVRRYFWAKTGRR